MNKNDFAQYGWPETSIWPKSPDTGKPLSKWEKGSSSLGHIHHHQPHPQPPTLGARLDEVQDGYISVLTCFFNQVLLCGQNLHDCICSGPVLTVCMDQETHTKCRHILIYESHPDAFIWNKSPFIIADEDKKYLIFKDLNDLVFHQQLSFPNRWDRFISEQNCTVR